MVEDLLTAHEQDVYLPPLRNAAPRFRQRWEVVAVDDGDALEMICKHPRRPQASDAAADDNRMITRAHSASLLKFERCIS